MPYRDPERQREYQRQYRVANPGKVKARSARTRAANRDKIKDRHREYRAANRDQIRDRRRWHLHGLWPEDWQALWDAQGGKCYLCGDPMPGDPSEASLDHDHRCHPRGRSCRLCQRGLAHDACNTLIGLAGDDPARLRLIARNLERARRRVDRHLPARLTLF